MNPILVMLALSNVHELIVPDIIVALVKFACEKVVLLNSLCIFAPVRFALLKLLPVIVSLLPTPT
mgnify:CR=1 FL=1